MFNDTGSVKHMNESSEPSAMFSILKRDKREEKEEIGSATNTLYKYYIDTEFGEYY